MVFVGGVLLVVRPCLAGWLGVDTLEGTPARGAIGAVLLFMTASALMTELMGIHALFGAFLAGVVMAEKKEFREYLTLQLQDFSGVFLLPLFFAFSGLRNHLGL